MEEGLTLFLSIPTNPIKAESAAEQLLEVRNGLPTNGIQLPGVAGGRALVTHDGNKKTTTVERDLAGCRDFPRDGKGKFPKPLLIYH